MTSQYTGEQKYWLAILGKTEENFRIRVLLHIIINSLEIYELGDKISND